MRIGVCEDEQKIREYIGEKIQDLAKSEDYKIKYYSSGEALLHALEQEKFDVYYLDIELQSGGMNGYILAKEIRKLQPSAILIFITSHVEYACEGYELDVFRFLCKPINEEKFAEAFYKSLDLWKKGNVFFTYKQRGRLQKVKKRDILYFDVYGKEIHMKLCSGKEIIYKGSLRDVIEKLDGSGFAQCYKSIYVQLSYVQYVLENEIGLFNQEELPLSRTYKNRFIEKYAEFNWEKEETN